MKFQVTDDDDDEQQNGGPFIYEIKSGNYDTAFRITQNGELRTAIRFNHRVTSQYRLQIRVYDNGQPTLYSDTWVNIHVSLIHYI